MKTYEHQAKALFRKYGIAVPRGILASTPEEAVSAAKSLAMPVVVKAQIYAGGRGKAGGIRIAQDLNEVGAFASALLGSRLKTAQTLPVGELVSGLLVEEVVARSKELYAAVTIDRSAARPVVLVSGEGGVEIESLAAQSPHKIIKEYVDPALGLRKFQASRPFFSLGLAPHIVSKCASVLLALYRLFMENDCANAEINPLAITDVLDAVALDGKVSIDDNALFRHPDLAAWRDTAQEDPLEVEAGRFGLNYIKLKGSVGCMVNGAGLAMATMDLIKLAGAEPANFLDVGGGATVPMIKEGLRIVLSDKNVKVLLINIFGGILRCDTLAAGVKEAAAGLDIGLPVVVRLEGTNREMGEKILASSALNFISVASLREASEKLKELLR